MKKKYILFHILIFMIANSYGQDKVLNQKKVPVFGRVNQQLNINLYPPILYLHEVGFKTLMSQGYATFNVIANSTFTVYFSTKSPSGNISKNTNYLKTYYMVLPYNAPNPTIVDRNWMDATRFNSYYETPSDYADYKRKIYVKAIKNSPPYGIKEYEEEIVVRIIDIYGNNYMTGLKIFYK